MSKNIDIISVVFCNNNPVANIDIDGNLIFLEDTSESIRDAVRKKLQEQQGKKEE